MAAAVVKGIIVSVAVIAALGIAVLENPHVQEWLDEQRRKLAELLRSIGEELDPESRRAAEAFAYEGRTLVNDEGLRREASGAVDAASLATGRSLSGSGTVRRVPIQGRIDPAEAEDRQRQGQEYLARRKQQMIELQERRKATTDGNAPAAVPSTFDTLLDADGKLKTPDAEETLRVLSPSPTEIWSEDEKSDAEQPLSVASVVEAAGGFAAGSAFSNPFSDEYAIDRSTTPRPPVPPKIELDSIDDPPEVLPSSLRLEDQSDLQNSDARLSQSQHDALSFEEQLAIALSLSEAESGKAAAAAASAARQLHVDEHDDDLKAAIEASLRDVISKPLQDPMHASPSMNEKQVPYHISESQSNLIDLTNSNSLSSFPAAIAGPSDQTLSMQDATTRDRLRSPSPVRSDTTDDLYTVTPQLTHARLASFNNIVADGNIAARVPPSQLMEASFYSAPSSVTPKSRPEVQETRGTASLAARDWTSESDMTADHEELNSRASLPSRTVSPEPAVSSFQDAELIDIRDDTDVDMLSEEGDSIMTPDSWTEVGSRDGEESEADDNARVLAAV